MTRVLRRNAPPEGGYDIGDTEGVAAVAGALPPEAGAMPVTERDVRNALKAVKDPELNLDLVVLGLVYDIDVAEDGAVHVVISLTSPGCPVADQILEDARTAALGVEGVEKVEVELTFDPPWTPERISPLIRSSLGI